MTSEEIASINRARCAEFAETLNTHHCTAAVLIGVGHDHQSGELHICHPANLSAEWVANLLIRVLSELDAELAARG